jgi:hypothetical protein
MDMTHDEKRYLPPPVPPVPTARMAPRDKARLAADMRAVPRSEMWRDAAQEYVRPCSARIWTSLCLDGGVAPAAAQSPTSAGHMAVLPRFEKAVGAIGIHRADQVADWHAPQVAVLAAALWREAAAPPQGRCAPPTADRPFRLVWATSGTSGGIPPGPADGGRP